LAHATGDTYTLYESIISGYLAIVEKLLAKPSYDFANVSATNVPDEPGVYVIYDKIVKAVIYTGRTKNLRRRLLSDHRRGNVEGSRFRKALKQHLALESESEITSYILENCSFYFMAVENFEEMVRLEHFIIAVLAPVLNIKLKQ